MIAAPSAARSVPEQMAVPQQRRESFEQLRRSPPPQLHELWVGHAVMWQLVQFSEQRSQLA